MKHKCPKCGAERDSFEEMFAHLCSCKGPKGYETTEILSESGGR